ncbi:unnamed protein product [Dibothriocephalus latus]|uniref:Uncharacterized protein n=1 Tax=Dibothriocephalus latus TaxID=60516 RepID=A0A3P6SZN8_DIBLA|nr:unnamed protein product [Dibothriocephalus latus]
MCPVFFRHGKWQLSKNYICRITDEILATARPSTEIIRKKNLINVFKEFQIKTIINMQIPGEHPHCGDGINKTGFSYDPEIFMEAGCRPSLDLTQAKLS